MHINNSYFAAYLYPVTKQAHSCLFLDQLPTFANLQSTQLDLDQGQQLP